MRPITLSRDKLDGRTDKRGRQERVVFADDSIKVMRLAGSAHSGTAGWVYHAVRDGGHALCGKRPEGGSGGWVDDGVMAVTCRRCAETLMSKQ